MTGAGTAVKMLKNTVTGQGQIGTIAQNGIVVVSGAIRAGLRTTPSAGNGYTPGPTT